MAGHKGSKYYNIFLEQQVRLVSDGETIISEEGFRLLLEIEARNSIVSAAKEMGISYRKAWGLLRDIEHNLGFSLAGKQRGGRNGGRTSFTAEGKELLEAYRNLVSGLEMSGKEPIRNFFRSINSITEKR
jgi:molybdate transport repressor ModE-like protein